VFIIKLEQSPLYKLCKIKLDSTQILKLKLKFKHSLKTCINHRLRTIYKLSRAQRKILKRQNNIEESLQKLLFTIKQENKTKINLYTKLLISHISKDSHQSIIAVTLYFAISFAIYEVRIQTRHRH